MNTFHTEPIILFYKQFETLADLLRKPNKEYINQRDKLFEKADAEINIIRIGMDIKANIPNLNLSFLDQMENKKV